MSFGFKFKENMAGYHAFDVLYGSYINEPSVKKFMEFDIVWGPNDIKKWLNPFSKDFMTQPVEGSITIDGLCYDQPCTGTLKLAYHRGEIVYKLYFTHQGRRFYYEGKKTNIRPWNLHINHTTCVGKIISNNADLEWKISDSVVFFKISQLGRFLRSFRIVRK